MELTAPMMREIRDEIGEAIQGIAERRGLILSMQSGTYKPDKGTCIVEVSVPNGKVKRLFEKERKAFLERCELYGLIPEHVGRDIVICNEYYTIIGLNTRAIVYPFLVRNRETKEYFRCTTETIYRGLGIDMDEMWAKYPNVREHIQAEEDSCRSGDIRILVPNQGRHK